MGFLVGLLSGMAIGVMVSIIVSSAGEREIWEDGVKFGYGLGFEDGVTGKRRM